MAIVIEAADAFERCPRCMDRLRGFEHDRGAGSRVTEDRAIRICGRCGSDEAVGRGVVPVALWPMAGAS